MLRMASVLILVALALAVAFASGLAEVLWGFIFVILLLGVAGVMIFKFIAE